MTNILKANSQLNWQPNSWRNLPIKQQPQYSNAEELRKVEDSIPDGLKTISNNRLKTINSSLSDAHNTLKYLKNKVREHKKSTYQRQVDEKKK